MTTSTARAIFLFALLLPTLAIPSTGTEPAEEGLVVRSDAGRTTLRIDGAEPFHATDRPVIEDRLIELEDSPVRIALWSEVTADGATDPYYAISLDGRAMAAVRRTSYRLELRQGSFDPVAGMPEVEAQLTAGTDANLYFVQFVTQPLEEYREAVAALGGTVHKFLSNHAHFVRMEPEVRDAVAALPFVRWVGPVHPAFKLEEVIREQIVAEAEIAPRRYSIMLNERGGEAQDRVVAVIRAMGGEVHGTTPQGFRIEATLSLQQVRRIVALDDVMFLDRKSKLEVDMDIVRDIGGANYLETVAGFTGAGVRAEVADTELDEDHTEWSAPPIIHVPGSNVNHGTSVYGILFARGADPRARGLIPDGVGIFSYSVGLLGGGLTRYQHTAELVDPDGPYRTVLQTNSTGDSQTSSYTTVSAEMDDMLFLYDIVLTQSQSNLGSTSSRPQAWAKNIVSCGAVEHYDTQTRDDDCWCSTGSIGPAADGRIKPDLSFFYDDTYTASAGNGYTEFGGTSGATPSVAGYIGLFHQMWSEQAFGNEVPVPGGTVFENRPHMTTAKAAMINTASPWDFTGTADDLTRVHQGWGMPDIRYLYDAREKITFIDESELLGNMQSVEYVAFVPPGEPELRATMVYADPMGTPGAGVHRINDLTLKLTSPSDTIYWGNHGLIEGNWSVPDGDANTIDTVENVFVQTPESGVWMVEIIASEVNEDGHIETPELDADFALVVSGADLAGCSPKGRLQLYDSLYTCGDEMLIRVIDCDLNSSDTVVDSVTVSVTSTTEPGGETVVLTETTAETADFRGALPLDLVDADGVLQVSVVDLVTAIYVDADDGQGNTDVVLQVTADVDCVPPVISNVQSSDVTGQGATVTWLTDEPADSLVTYGTPAPGLTEAIPGLVTLHVVGLSGLDECSPYSYSVTSADQAGNPTTHDNGGVFFEFETGINVMPVYTTAEPPVSIPDNDPSAGAEMSIDIVDDELIVDLNVEVYITHTFTGDLELSLIGPDGTEVILSHLNGGSGNNYAGTIFDDEADVAVASGSAPFTGSFRPDEPLSIFDGTPVTGQWRLRVEDYELQDVGTIDSFSLHLTYPSKACGPHLKHDAYAIEDSCSGFGSGGSNGNAEPAEDVLLTVTLTNDGTDATTGVSARLSTVTPGVTVTQPVSSYPDLASGESADNLLSPFGFTIDKSVPCGSPIELALDADANEGAWTDEITLFVGGAAGAASCKSCIVPLPGAVTDLSWNGGGKRSLGWTEATGAHFYHLYRGVRESLPNLLDDSVDSCERWMTLELETGDVLAENPPENSIFWYLVRGGNGGGTGGAGNATAGPRIVNEDGICP